MGAQLSVAGQSEANQTATEEKIFGGCGCGSPFAFKQPDRTIVLKYPNDPSKGHLILTAQQLKALRGMIEMAEKDRKI